MGIPFHYGRLYLLCAAGVDLRGIGYAMGVDMGSTRCLVEYPTFRDVKGSKRRVRDWCELG